MVLKKVPEEGGCFLNEARSHIFLLQVAPGERFPSSSPHFFPRHFQDLFLFRNDLGLVDEFIVFSHRNPPLPFAIWLTLIIFFRMYLCKEQR